MIWPFRRVKAAPSVGRCPVMGTVAYQEVYGIGGDEAVREVERELDRLDELWSPCRADTIVSKIGQSAGIGPVPVDSDTEKILAEALSIGNLSHGVFDVTAEPLIRLWRSALRTKEPPGKEDVESALNLVCRDELKITPDHQVYLSRRGQGVDLGGIGKGFAADRARMMYQQAGIRNAVINLGGNCLVMGSKPDGSPWKVGIRNPRYPRSEIVGYVEVRDSSVVTSGDYEKFFDCRDHAGEVRRYHHILDPRTGWPARSGLWAVTVISSSSILCDALATAAFVLGQEKGMELCRSLESEALLIDSNGGMIMTEGVVFRKMNSGMLQV